jgi:two-component system response regulator CpxR
MPLASQVRHQQPARSAGLSFVLPGPVSLKHLKRSGFHIMRPKKVILCVNDNEQELSVLTFMLSTNGYRVVPFTSGQEAITAFAGMQVDLVLADYAMPQMNGNQLVSRLKQIASHVPMILLGDPQAMGGQIHLADALLAKKQCSTQELLERIKVMSARKRGPRKGALRQAPVAELAVAS